MVRGFFREDSAAGGWGQPGMEGYEVQLELMASPQKNSKKKLLFLVESLNLS